MTNVSASPVGSRDGSDGGRGLSVAVVSTFPPTSCGLATFASALSRALGEVGVEHLGSVRCIQEGDDDAAGGDGLLWMPRPDRSVERISRHLNEFDVVLLQHEYGIFGADDGVAVLHLLDALDVPVIPTLHTVPVSPTKRQRRILESVVARSTASVVMTEAARQRLVAGFDVDPAKVHNIPHGATLPPAVAANRSDVRYVLTWGLLGPGKGIEWVVDALAMAPLRDVQVEFRVVGRTHPKILARDGTAYVDMLAARARELGVDDRIIFDDRYHSLENLLEIVAGAEVVVLPYDSRDQITSGVLVDAVTAGVPVVATAFPHAEELLADGAGVIVPHGDSAAIARAIHAVVDDPATRERMASRARELGASHEWRTVALEYLRLARSGGRDVVPALAGEVRSMA